MKNDYKINEDEIRDIIDIEVEDDIDDDIDDGPQPLTSDQIEGIISTAIGDAIDFIESDISEDRLRAQRYFEGKTDLGHEDGRSKVVATKVRDTIRSIKPSLMRIFLSSGRYVEYVPRGPEDVQMAEQATAYMHYKLEELNGFKLLSDVFHDALVKKTGILKVYYEDYDKSEIHTFTGLSDNQYMAIMIDQDIEVLEHSETVEQSGGEIDGMQMPETETRTHDMKIMRRASTGDLCVVSVPPEDFFIDSNARSIDDCYVCGHRTDMRVGDLVEMGFEFDDVADLGGSTDNSNSTAQLEDDERRGYTTNHDDDENSADPSMRKVMVTDAYMRMDVDGTGVPILHHFILGGGAYKVLSVEPCDQIPFAIFEVSPEPHAMFGTSVADLIMEDQDASTSVLRGILDNVAMTNSPRIGVVEGQVNMDDALNSNEIGGIIRMRQPGAVIPLAVPFAAGQTLSAMQYLDSTIETKTGVSRASMGLDPDALQSTTRAAVTATVQAAAGQTEVMARNLAEGGMRRLFKLMLALVVKHADAAQFMRLNGEYVEVDPRSWDTAMNLSINVGLGTGREEEKTAAYREVLGLQMQVYGEYGPENGVVSLVNIRNTVADMMASVGIRNSERFFKPITVEYEQQLAMQRQQQAQMQQQQGPQDAQAMAFMQAEQLKSQTKAQSDAMRIQLDAQKALMKDDFDRDKMYQDMIQKNAEIEGKFGLQVNEQQIRAEQERQRMMMQQQR